MSKLIDSICKLRDILENKNYSKLGYCRQLSQTIFDEVHRNIKRKFEDYNYSLDFTSQDLRETAQCISDTFKRWDNIMNPIKQIKKLEKSVKDNRLCMQAFYDETIPIMQYRRDYGQVLTELRSLLEYHAVFLYYLEEASGDEFALKYIERIT
jgi:hypothetical protein